MIGNGHQGRPYHDRPTDVRCNDAMTDPRHPSWCDPTECTVGRTRGEDAAAGGHASRRTALGRTAVQLIQAAGAKKGGPLVRIFDLSRGRRYLTVPLHELRQSLANLEAGTDASASQS